MLDVATLVERLLPQHGSRVIVAFIVQKLLLAHRCLRPFSASFRRHLPATGQVLQYHVTLAMAVNFATQSCCSCGKYCSTVPVLGDHPPIQPHHLRGPNHTRAPQHRPIQICHYYHLPNPRYRMHLRHPIRLSHPPHRRIPILLRSLPHSVPPQDT